MTVPYIVSLYALKTNLLMTFSLFLRLLTLS